MSPPPPPLSRHCSGKTRRRFKTLGEPRGAQEEENKGLVLQENLWLTGANTGGCVIFFWGGGGRGVQSQGFWVMGLVGGDGGAGGSLYS